ncbi:MAG: phosphate ABC transporter permease subunit PstC [Lachnospiraceae bacterium]|nr:phosphate ABC transporter permease subunit PstC [Lachnospiraceae bacterium]
MEKTLSVSIIGNKKAKSIVELIAKCIFIVFAVVAIVAVLSITIYMLYIGTPALTKVGIADFLFGTEWAPTAIEPKFGIFYVILTSIAGTIAALLIGVPIGILTAVFLAEVGSKKISAVVQPAVELLAAIPSVIYGLVGVKILKPWMFELEKWVFQDSNTHQFTGGANLLSAIFVLAIMILPTVINVSTSSIRAVQSSIKSASLALGATKIQTIFKVILPAAKSGIMTAVVLGLGRALGEAMAINMVAGNAVNLPLPFHSVKFLTTAIVSEMGYSSGVHREILFTIGLVLFAFILFTNLILTRIIQKGDNES